MIKYLIFSVLVLLFETSSWGLTANRVWVERLPHGQIRVHVNYTLTNIKQYREAYAEFYSLELAEKYYWHLVRGGDFYLGPVGDIQFEPVKKTPDPW